MVEQEQGAEVDLVEAELVEEVLDLAEVELAEEVVEQQVEVEVEDQDLFI